MRTTITHSDLRMRTVKWSEMFESETDLVEMLKLVDFDTYQKSYKGYEYVRGFLRTLDSGKELSKAQMTQLKRNAKEIYRYHLDLRLKREMVRG